MLIPAPRLRADVATGAAVLAAVDFLLPGPIPLVLARHYRSASVEGGSLGPGWCLGLDVSLDIGETVTCHGGPFDGAAFAPVPEGRAAQQEATGLTLEHLADAYVLFASRSRQLVFLKRHHRGAHLLLSAVRAGNGRALQIERSGDRIAEVREPLGRLLRLSHGSAGVESIDLVAPGARPVAVARYTYAGGRLRSAAGADGRTEQYDYADAYLTAVRSRGGALSYAQYAADGRCLALWGDDGSVQLAYDDLRQTTRVVGADGGQTLFRHVQGRQVLERIDPEGGTHNFYYDAAERLAGHGTAAGVRAFQNLDLAEGKLSHLHREGRVAFVTYGEHGLAQSASDAFENTTQLHWSESHALTGVTDAGGETWTFERDDEGRVAAVASPEGRSARLVWERDRMTAEDAEGTRWRETLDALGRVTERVDRSGRRQQFRYGADGRLAEARLGDSYAAEFLYTPDGLLTGVADSERSRVRLDRDGAGRLTGRSGTSGPTVRFERDAEARITAAIGDVAVRLSYDGDGRLVRVQSDDRDRAYTYDGGETTVTDDRGTRRYSFPGDLVEQTDADSQRQTFEYGPSGELMAWESTDGDDTSGWLGFAYAPTGRLSTVSGRLTAKGAPAECKLSYDRDGCLVALSDASGPALQIEADVLARPVKVQGLGASVTLTYDGADRIIGVEAPGGAVQIAYDDLDRIVAVRRGEQTLDFRTNADAVWSETIARREPDAPLLPDTEPSGEDSADAEALGTEARDDRPALSLALRAERLGVALIAHVGPLAVPLYVGCDARCPRAGPTAQRVAAALRGPSAVFAPVAQDAALLAVWRPDPRRDIRLDATAVPRSHDVGLPGEVLDAFYLDASHLETVPFVAGMAPGHQDDASRGPSDLLTGPHRRGALRPSPWPSRSLRALMPRPDLLAPDGAPSADDLLDFLARDV